MNKFYSVNIGLFVVLSCLLQACSSDVVTQGVTKEKMTKTNDLTTVVTESGLLQGVENKDIITYRGIPYAKAPVNELRWMPPQPIENWKGVKHASRFGNDCMQRPFPGDAAPLGEPVSEDCLYLNVWKPKQAETEKLPVMVWIHGGGFVNGGASPAIYTGEKFAESGVIFVSFNYRVGRFGFFAHPALTAESKSAGDAELGNALGNYGFMDQIAALQWVNKNIAAFGGDTNNITLFGESAGGRSVNALMLSPKSKGLFHKAIVQSGGGRTSEISPALYLNKTVLNTLTKQVTSNKYAEDYGVAFAKKNGITTTDVSALKQLRTLPAEQVLDGLNMASMNNNSTYSGPMIDGQVIVENDDEGFRKGHQMKIPYIIGANELEWGFFSEFAPEAAKGIAMGTLAKAGQRREQFIAAYKPYLHRGKKTAKEVDYEFLGSMLRGDIGFVEPSRFLARQAQSAGQPVWLYRFNYVPAHLIGKVKGAYHATEIPFVFDTGTARYGEDFQPVDQKTSHIMHNYWVNFAKKGKPEGAKLPVWPMYKQGEEQVIEFNSEGAEAKIDPLFERLNELELTL